MKDFEGFLKPENLPSPCKQRAASVPPLYKFKRFPLLSHLREFHTRARARESDPAFDAFWSEYPNKANKPRARKEWDRLKPEAELVAQIMQGLARWKQSDQWTRDDGRFIQHPATWLHGRQWEDEVHQRRHIRTVTAQEYEQRDYSGVQDELMARQDAEMEAYMAAENAKKGTA